jgi:hypothetical protein
MPDIGGGIGRALSGLGEGIGRAAETALESLGSSLASIPGGPIWLVVLAVLVAGGWILAKR